MAVFYRRADRFAYILTRLLWSPMVQLCMFSTFMKSEVNKLLKANEQLNQLDSVKVVSHVQREIEDWYLNTLMLQDYDVPFKYKRKRKYRDLKGASVNLTYYPQTELVAGMDFEYMKVVRIRRS